VAQVVECLLYRHKALSSNPRPTKKKKKERKKKEEEERKRTVLAHEEWDCNKRPHMGLETEKSERKKVLCAWAMQARIPEVTLKMYFLGEV
jgi:hypothetical protein